MVHTVKISRENGRLASARSGSNFHDGIAVFVFIRRQQGNLNFAFEATSRPGWRRQLQPTLYVIDEQRHDKMDLVLQARPEFVAADGRLLQAQFFELQRQAVELLAEDYRKIAAWAEITNAYNVPEWRYEAAGDGHWTTPNRGTG